MKRNELTRRPVKKPTPVAEAHRKLHTIIGVMEKDQILPSNPNWMAELQDLLEDMKMNLDDFATLSWGSGWGPNIGFLVLRGRLRLSDVPKKRPITAERILWVIKRYYR
jgi:hypothetical protein